MKKLLECNGKKYSDEDLIEAFHELGISKGDILCVHTELFKFGTPLLSKNEFLKTLLECFFQVIGDEGTLIMPTFTYSFCKNRIYDKANSITKMGALNEYFRKWAGDGGRRTNDPIFSFTIKGAKENLFLKDTTSCFGENSVYDILYKNNGKFITFGGIGHTLTHYAEEQFGVNYRYHKNFTGKMIDEFGRLQDKDIACYVRKLDIASMPNLENIVNIVGESKNHAKFQFAGEVINIYDAKEYVKALWQALKKDGSILIRL